MQQAVTIGRLPAFLLLSVVSLVLRANYHTYSTKHYKGLHTILKQATEFQRQHTPTPISMKSLA